MQTLVALLLERIPPATAADAGVEYSARVVTLWQDIFAVFAPIIGQGGAHALLRRSLSLSIRMDFTPSIAATATATATDKGPGFLRAALEHLTAVEVAAANELLVRNFLELLAGLIGPSLTERLLLQALAASPSEAHSQRNHI